MAAFESEVLLSILRNFLFRLSQLLATGEARIFRMALILG